MKCTFFRARHGKKQKERERDLKEIKEEGGLAAVKVTARHANVPIYLTGEH